MRRSLLVAVVMAVIAAPAPVGAGEGEPFTASISRLDRETKELMTGSSWHEGCPVGLGHLRLVRLTYIGFDGEAHHGRLVVHRLGRRDRRGLPPAVPPRVPDPPPASGRPLRRR